jgi:hypothetical protein
MGCTTFTNGLPEDVRGFAAPHLQDPLVVAVESANVYGAADVFRRTDGTLVSYRDVVGAEPGSGPFYDLGGEPIIIRTGF